MHLIQILLPIPRGKQPPDDTRFVATRQELVDRFDGVTAYVRSPAQGVWVAPDGAEEHDDVVMVEIVADDFDREWWRAYERTLAARFNQEEIHIRALPIEQP